MRFLGLTCLIGLSATAAILAFGGRADRSPAVRDGSDAAVEPGGERAAADYRLVGCVCRREVIDSDGITSLWRCTAHNCAPCQCAYANVTYEVHPVGESPGQCDALCSHVGCRQIVYNTEATSTTSTNDSFKLAAPQAPGIDDVASLGFPTGPASENKHIASAVPKDPWFVETGGVRLRLVQLDVERVGGDGKATTVRIPVGYETTAGPEKQGKVEFVRALQATDLTGGAPVPTTIEGFYEVGVRRTPDAAVEFYTVRTANSLAVTP